MPKVKANNITMNYEQQGAGDPLILIPFLTADNACYAFQVAEYAKHFTCISLDLRGTRESDKPEGEYSTETSCAFGAPHRMKMRFKAGVQSLVKATVVAIARGRGLYMGYRSRDRD